MIRTNRVVTAVRRVRALDWRQIGSAALIVCSEGVLLMLAVTEAWALWRALATDAP